MNANHDGHDASDEAIVRRVLELVSELRVDEALGLVAEDLLLELPFRHDGGPGEMRGEAARRFIHAMPKLFSRMNFTSITVHGRARSGTICAEYRSDGRSQGGEPYRNAYAAFFVVRDGKIAEWREYFDPMVVRTTFKLP